MAKSKPKYKRVAQLKSAEDFQNHIDQLNLKLPFKEMLSGPDETCLANPAILKSGKKIGNRFCILPMEGWDGTEDGLPSDLTKRRWHNFRNKRCKASLGL